jgi:hypothetical protein
MGSRFVLDYVRSVAKWRVAEVTPIGSASYWTFEAVQCCPASVVTKAVGPAPFPATRTQVDAVVQAIPRRGSLNPKKLWPLGPVNEVQVVPAVVVDAPVKVLWPGFGGPMATQVVAPPHETCSSVAVEVGSCAESLEKLAAESVDTARSALEDEFERPAGFGPTAAHVVPVR